MCLDLCLFPSLLGCKGLMEMLCLGLKIFPPAPVPVTNYSPFPSGEEHPVLILTCSSPGKPRDVWPLQQLQGGSEDLAKRPVSFALASTPAVHASTSRNPECVPLKSCWSHSQETSAAVLSSSCDSHRSPTLGCSPP